MQISLMQQAHVFCARSSTIFGRVFPAMDIAKCGTHKEGLPVPQAQVRKMYVLRRILNPMGSIPAG